MVKELEWLYSFGPEGARAVLSAIAGSMITVAGLTFSMTMVTLQLASSQYGPRILRNFMRDRGNQVVLGTFISTFVYCLLVLRTVRGVEGYAFVPHVSVSVGVLMSIASLAVLIFFIHHTASSIRVEALLAKLTQEAKATLDRLYPASIGEAPPAQPRQQKPLPADLEERAKPIGAWRSGYVEFVDGDALMALCNHYHLCVVVNAPPGTFVRKGATVMHVYPRERLSDAMCDEATNVMTLGLERTPTHDITFAVQRVVEIAQRSLSPSTNDPTTACYCLDRIEELLMYMAEREMPDPHRYNDAQELKVVTPVVTLEVLASSVLRQVARYGGQDADVRERLRQLMDKLGTKAPYLQPHLKPIVAHLEPFKGQI